MLNLDTILQNRYRIVTLLGQGGMGAVYKAIDQRLSLTVALKETLTDTEELRRAFEREARLLANLNHPLLPRVIDHFIEGQGQYLVMDYIAGDDLGTMLSKRGMPFTVDEVMRWSYDLLEVLDYLHSHDPQILHRDIKPANIKISARGKAMLLDFGLARGKAGGMTEATLSRSIFGYSPHYASFEQMQGDRTSERSDLYSLALTMYNLLTNVKPADALSRATAIFNDEPDPLVPIQQLVLNLPNHVAEAVMNAAALKPASRPKSATEMLSIMSGNYNNNPLNQTWSKYEGETVVRQPKIFKVTNPGHSETRNQSTMETLLSIDEPVIAININQSYKVGMSAIDLYDHTRGIWRLSKERAERAEYAFAVYQGVIKEVYEIDGWHRAGATEYKIRRFNPEEFKTRFEFTGRVADDSIRGKYVEKLLPEKHGQNPIRYFNC